MSATKRTHPEGEGFLPAGTTSPSPRHGDPTSGAAFSGNWVWNGTVWMKDDKHPFTYDVAKGEYPNHTSVNKFGRNSAVPAGREEIWDGSAAYEYIADDVFSTMYISSDAAGDTSLTWSVTGIDSDYNYSTVTVTTDASDGRTFVALTSGATDNKWWRIFRAVNTSGTAATGNIYISKDNTDAGADGIPDTLTDIQAKVLIGNEQTLMAMWTCPVDYKAYITHYYASTSTAKVSEVGLFVKPFGGVFNNKSAIDINQGYMHHRYDFPIEISAKSDVLIKGATTGAGGVISAGFDLWFEPA
jgi:hypothetical protein